MPKTTIKALKEAWKILKKANLHELLTGSENPLKLDLVNTVDALLEQNLLLQFMHAISEQEYSDDSTIKEVMEEVEAFFTSIGKNLPWLTPTVQQLAPAQPQQ